MMFYECSRLPSTVTVVTRVSQLGIEVLVIVVTWWYNYQSYRVQKGRINLGQSISSVLVYNGESVHQLSYVRS